MADKQKQLAAALRAHALSLPEAWEDHPWGENVAKVGKKVFVFFGVPDPRGEQLIVCVKLPRSGVAALDQACCEPAGYGLGKAGWVAARFSAAEAPPQKTLEAWIEESYRAIAPRKLVALLDGAAAPRKARRK
jgi:predicted DNA-binding protein (MmcQ/YjbR family)